MVASSFSCIGLGSSTREEFAALVARLGAASEAAATIDGVTVHHWRDPSGAMVALALDQDNELAEMVPTLDVASVDDLPVAHLRSLGRGPAPRYDAAVFEDDEQVTAVAFETPSWWELGEVPMPARVDGAVVALGVAMTAFPDEAAYVAASKTLDTPGAGVRPRFAPESFIPSGMFGSTPSAQGVLSGTVLAAERRRNTLTDQDFVVATVRTVGFTAAVCLPGSDFAELPTIGGILSGGVQMTATLV